MRPLQRSESALLRSLECMPLPGQGQGLGRGQIYRVSRVRSKVSVRVSVRVIASTTRTIAAISAVSSVASLVARRGTVTSATAAVAAASVVALSATPVSARLRSRRPAVATAGPTARTTIAPTRPPSPPLAAAARSRALIQQASQPCS
eukprot:scaffold48710_cov67-Phaeocystis_antarctica.AAC.4